MASLPFLRIATRSYARPISRSSCAVRRRQSPVPFLAISSVTVAPTGHGSFSTSASRSLPGSSAHHEESYDEFNERFEKEFDGVNDVFELQRNLNNVFAYDLVPTTAVLVAALKAARRVHDFPTAVRVFEGIKVKVDNKQQYAQYLDELKEFREELGVPLAEEMYPEYDKPV